MANLLIPIMLLVVFAGMLALLVYFLLSYRKRNIIKFAIVLCMVSGPPCCDIVIGQDEFGFNESEPTFETIGDPGPIMLPELNEACSLIEVTVDGLQSTGSGNINETVLDNLWNVSLLEMNMTKQNNKLAFIA